MLEIQFEKVLFMLFWSRYVLVVVVRLRDKIGRILIFRDISCQKWADVLCDIVD